MERTISYKTVFPIGILKKFISDERNQQQAKTYLKIWQKKKGTKWCEGVNEEKNCF